MKVIDFTKLGGYRFKQATLAKMQMAYFEILKVITSYLDIPATGQFIISGCDLVAGKITEGIMYIDGEVCPFEEITGDGLTKIEKEVILESLPFKNGTNPQVFRTTRAIVSITGVAYSEFTRIPQVKEMIWSNLSGIPVGLVIDSGYVHTDNNFTAALLTKLNEIEPKAEVNIQTDWNQNDNTKKDFLKNRPQGKLLTYLHKGSYEIGNPTTDDIVTITIPDVGTADYMVLATLLSKSDNYSTDNDVIFCIRDKTATSFKVALREFANATQNLWFDYVLIPF